MHPHSTYRLILHAKGKMVDEGGFKLPIPFQACRCGNWGSVMYFIIILYKSLSILIHSYYLLRVHAGAGKECAQPASEAGGH